MYIYIYNNHDNFAQYYRLLINYSYTIVYTTAWFPLYA